MVNNNILFIIAQKCCGMEWGSSFSRENAKTKSSLVRWPNNWYQKGFSQLSWNWHRFLTRLLQYFLLKWKCTTHLNATIWSWLHRKDTQKFWTHYKVSSSSQFRKNEGARARSSRAGGSAALTPKHYDILKALIQAFRFPCTKKSARQKPQIFG